MQNLLKGISRPVLVGSIVQASAALLLMIDLFLPWYGVSSFGVSLTATGWESLSWEDVDLRARRIQVERQVGHAR